MSTGSWVGLDVPRGEGDGGRAVARARGVDAALGVDATGGFDAAGCAVAVDAGNDPGAAEAGAGERGVGVPAGRVDEAAEPAIDPDGDVIGTFSTGLAVMHPANAMSKRISTNAGLTAAPAPGSAPRWWTWPAIRHSSLVI